MESNKHIIKKLYVKLVSYQNYTKMRGPKNINLLRPICYVMHH